MLLCRLAGETYHTLDTFVPNFWGMSSRDFQSSRWEQESRWDMSNDKMFKDFADNGKRTPPRAMPLLLNPFLVLLAQLDYSIVSTWRKSLSRHRAILAERAEHYADLYGFVNDSAAVPLPCD